MTVWHSRAVIKKSIIVSWLALKQEPNIHHTCAVTACCSPPAMTCKSWFINCSAEGEWSWPASPACTRWRCPMTTSTRWSCSRWKALTWERWRLWPPTSTAVTAAPSAWSWQVGCLSVCLFVCLSICLSVCLSVCLFVSLSIHLIQTWCNSVLCPWISDHSSTNFWNDHGGPGCLLWRDPSLCCGCGGKTSSWHPLVKGVLCILGYAWSPEEDPERGYG